jgi:hypothetical protein
MKENDGQKGYYAIIIAPVLNHETLSNDAKLLYGFITGLQNVKGYCWATNDYLAKLVRKSSRSVNTYLNELSSFNFITRQIIYDKATKRVIERRIFTVNPIEAGCNRPIETEHPIEAGCNRPIEAGCTDNTNTINSNILTSEEDKSSPAHFEIMSSPRMEKKKPKSTKEPKPTKVSNPEETEKMILFQTLVMSYEQAKVGNRKHAEKKFLTLTLDEAKLAEANSTRYLNCFSDDRRRYVVSLQNYIDGKIFNEATLASYEQVNKPKAKTLQNSNNFSGKY